MTLFAKRANHHQDQIIGNNNNNKVVAVGHQRWIMDFFYCLFGVYQQKNNDIDDNNVRHCHTRQKMGRGAHKKPVTQIELRVRVTGNNSQNVDDDHDDELVKQQWQRDH